MPQAQSQPPKPRKRRSSTTRFLRSAVAAGLPIRSVEVDPSTGKFTMLVGEPVPLAKPPAADADKSEPDDDDPDEWDRL
jgi:hypothetical protein